MIQTKTKLLTFAEFVEWYPDDGGRYELIDGAIARMQPTGRHEEIAGFLATELSFEIRRLQLPYFIPRSCIVKVPQQNTGYIPDAIALDRQVLSTETLWEKASSITKGESARLVVEVVSTNWRDDYYKKFADYELMGIPEYWIVDYLALGGRRYIGSPKLPTVSVCSLIEGEYQVNQFRGAERLVSPTFPELTLTAEQVFAKAMGSSPC